MANQKGGYKHSAFTEFMKDIKVGNSKSIITLKCEKHQHSHSFRKLGVDGFLKYFRGIRRTTEIVNFVLQLDKEKTNSSKGNCQVGSNVKNIAEKLKTSIFSKGKRACYIFNVLHVDDNNAKTNMKIYVITFNHKGIRGGFFIFNNSLYTFNTNSARDFYVTENSRFNRNISALKNISGKASKKMVIYWVRHGWSCGNMLQYTGKLKRLDMPKYTPDAQLSGLGTIQSTLLGYNSEMKEILQKATIIGSSELTRAIQTACYAMKSAGISCTEGGKCLEIIPKANESMWFMKGKLKYIIPKAVGIHAGRSAVALSYDDMEQFYQKIGRLGSDYGVNMNLSFYDRFYKTRPRNISNNKRTLIKQITNQFDNDPFFTREDYEEILEGLSVNALKQMAEDKLRKDHKDAIISASHEAFMIDVLPKLYKCAKNKAPEDEIPTVVIFGHGNYIKKIMERSSKEYNDEGIYNTGVYEVHYEQYGDNTQFVARNGRRLFPVDRSGNMTIKKEIYNALEKKEEINNWVKQNRNHSVKYGKRSITSVIQNIVRMKKVFGGFTLTNYLELIGRDTDPLSHYAVVQDIGEGRRLFFYRTYGKPTNDMYYLPIPITGQKIVDPNKMLIKLWDAYPKFYIGDAPPEYEINKARYRNNVLVKDKFKHGCLDKTHKKISKPKKNKKSSKTRINNVEGPVPVHGTQENTNRETREKKRDSIKKLRESGNNFFTKKLERSNLPPEKQHKERLNRRSKQYKQNAERRLRNARDRRVHTTSLSTIDSVGSTNNDETLRDVYIKNLERGAKLARNKFKRNVKLAINKPKPKEIIKSK